MNAFLSNMFAEIGARRKRMRISLGDRTQSILDFLVLAGLLIGSLGLFVGEWMPAAAPWGFAVPVLFAIGYVTIEYRRQAQAVLVRQRAEADNEALDRVAWSKVQASISTSDPERAAIEEARERVRFDADAEKRRETRANEGYLEFAPGYDWVAVLWGFACALLGAAAFVLAWGARPPPPPDPDFWTPPETGTVDSDLSNPPPANP